MPINMTELAHFRYPKAWEPKLVEKMKAKGYHAKAEFYRAILRKVLYED